MTKGHPEIPSGSLKHQEDQKGAHDDIHQAGASHPVDEVDVISPDIGGYCKGSQSQNHVIPDHLCSACLLMGRVHKEGDGEHQSHMQGAVQVCSRVTDEGGDEMI